MSVAVVVVDQLTKVAVRALWSSPTPANPLDTLLAGWFRPEFKPYESLPLLGDWLRLSLVHNQGAAFGLLPGKQPFFVATSLLVLALLGAYWFKFRPRGAVVVVALALAAAGAFGNLIDRVLIGNVTDFIDVAVIDFPVFNVADAAITVGAVVLVLVMLFEGPEETDAERAETVDGSEAVGDK